MHSMLQLTCKVSSCGHRRQCPGVKQLDFTLTKVRQILIAHPVFAEVSDLKSMGVLDLI